jgi:transcriptional regulator, TraR/DksA family
MTIENDIVYRPSDDEPYMNPRQLAYFRERLLYWKHEIVVESQVTIDNLREDTQLWSDVADRASSETDRTIELRARDRQRKLIAKIDAALQRIEDGEYGLLRGDGRANRPGAAGSASYRYFVSGGARTPRAARARS